MLNKKKYKDELEEILVTELAVRKGNGEIVTCEGIDCASCIFHTDYDDCDELVRKWLNQEYKSVDWSKVPVDTPILVRDSKRLVGLKDILQNMKMGMYMHGIVVKLHGVQTAILHFGTWQNLQKVRNKKCIVMEHVNI